MGSPATRRPVQFGRYELLRRLGAGGMGEVFLARLPGMAGFDKLCVVKKMLSHLSSDASFVERFFDEAKVVLHLAHGNIAQVFEMGEVDGEYFMAMEYVEGKTLARVNGRLRERGGRFPLPLALYLVTRVCDALAYAHRKADAAGRPLHLVHRDISPANILVSYDGEVKVIDFGAAQSSLKEAHTAPRMVIGNLAYMSPEQARKKPVDGRADIYSIAVVLWELVAWSPLPTGGGPADRWKRAAYPRFSSPSRFQADVPAEIDRIVMRGLSPDPRERQQCADELRDDLQRVLAQIASETSQSSLSALMRELFGEEAAVDRRQSADAVSDPVGERPRAAPVNTDEVTSPTSLPSDEFPNPRLLGDDNPDSRTTKPERRAVALPRPSPPRPPAEPDTVTDRGAPSIAAGMLPEDSELSEESDPLELSALNTASVRIGGHGLLRLLIFAAAFALGAIIAGVVYQAASSPAATPAPTERASGRAPQ